MLGICPPDYNIYTGLFEIVIKIANKKIPIYFISSHESAVNIIKQNYKNNPKEEINLINIDHHHDLYYGNKPNNPIIELECGNWVKYCKERNYIKHYTWIKNFNSNEPGEELENLINKTINITNINIKQVVDDTDVLIVCRSDEWIPTTYYSLFYVWIIACENILQKKVEIDNGFVY